MTAKHIKVTAKPKTPNTYREDIKKAVKLLGMMSDADSFDEIFEANEVTLSLGEGKTATTYICPETVEMIETFLMTLVCFSIQIEELDKFPYYKDLFNRFSAILNQESFLA